MRMNLLTRSVGTLGTVSGTGLPRGLVLGLALACVAGTSMAATVSSVIDFDSAPLGAFTSLTVGDFRFDWVGYGDQQFVRDLGGGNRALADIDPFDVFGAEAPMTRVDGGLFTVTQFDLINLNGGYDYFRVDVGPSSYYTEGTYTPSDIADVNWMDLNIVSGADFGADYAVDNIHVTYEVAPVPEPATYAMFAAGLGLLGIAARRRTPKAMSRV
jgi:hypothetical protein